MMESPMTRNCHVGFGERYEETHQPRDWKVRFVPTLFSPLLANVALHGMEERIKQYADTWKGQKRDNRTSLSLIRYADDFVIMHKEKAIILKCKEIISEWLKDMNLELKPSKTRITHTLHSIEGQEPGFNFLGFNIRQYECNRTKQGFKTLIKPSKESIKEHYRKIAETIDQLKSATQATLIQSLNPIIRGWSNYYKSVVTDETYHKLDHLVFLKLFSWAKKRHQKKGIKWVVKKYWHTKGNFNWEFAHKEENKFKYVLARHNRTETFRHTKVKGTASPYDGNLKYWSSRRGKHPEMPTRIAILLKAQKGKCTQCGLTFREEDVMEVDHIIPKSLGGKDEYKNLQILHKHCHDQKTTSDGSLRSTHDKSQVIEEPDEVKVCAMVRTD